MEDGGEYEEKKGVRMQAGALEEKRCMVDYSGLLADIFRDDITRHVL